MSDSGKPCCSSPKQVLITFAIFALFGFLALILTGNLGSRTPENVAAVGEFTEEVTQQRWANLKEVTEAQDAAVDPAKVDAALAALIQSPPKPAATQIVVPGSPTFLKQQAEASAAAPAAPAEEEVPKAEVKPEAKPAPAPAAGVPAPAAPAPAAAEEKK